MENSRIIGRIDLSQFVRQPIVAVPVVPVAEDVASGIIRTVRRVGIGAAGAFHPVTPRAGRCGCGAYLAKRDTPNVRTGECPNARYHPTLSN